MKRLFLIAAISSTALAQSPVSDAVKPGQSAKLAVPAVPGEKPAAQKPKKKGGPTVIVSREGAFKSSSQTAEFKGEVNVKGPEYEISCDRLRIKMKPKPAAGSEQPADAKDADPKADDPKAANAKADDDGGMGNIEEAIAEGNVIITQLKPGKAGAPPSRYLAKGKKAVFTSTNGSLVITGWPQILESIDGKPIKQTNALEESTKVTLFQSNDMLFDGGRAEVILYGKEKDKE